MNAFIDQLKRHRSVRRYRPAPVPDADILAAVQAGQSASTSSAIQTYCAIHIRDASHRRRLVELTGGQRYVGACGAFFAICGDVRRLELSIERTGGRRRARLEGFLLAVIDTTLFAQNMAVAFESMGYGVCFIGGLRSRLAEVDELLDLPDGVYPLFGLCVGVADETPTPRPRLDPSAVLFDDAYPDDEAIAHLVDEYDARYKAYLHQRGATPRTWSEVMAKKFAEPLRPDLAAYYTSKGADLS